MNGKTAMSSQNAKLINEKYPFYSTDFLLGKASFANARAEEHERVFETAFNEGLRGKIVLDIANSPLCSSSVELVSFDISEGEETVTPLNSVPFVRIIHEGKDAVMR